MSDNRAIIDGLSPGSKITLTFPVETTKEQHKVGDRTYTLTVKGNTVVDVTPRTDSTDVYQYYLRAQLRGSEAPTKEVARFVAEKILPLQ